MLTALVFTGARWLTFAVVIWSDVVFTLACLGYWALAARLFDIRQGKRLFGLITAGELAAGAAGGLSVPLVLRFAQTPLLLWLGAAGLGYASSSCAPSCGTSARSWAKRSRSGCQGGGGRRAGRWR